VSEYFYAKLGARCNALMQSGWLNVNDFYCSINATVEIRLLFDDSKTKR